MSDDAVERRGESLVGAAGSATAEPAENQSAPSTASAGAAQEPAEPTSELREGAAVPGEAQEHGDAPAHGEAQEHSEARERRDAPAHSEAQEHGEARERRDARSHGDSRRSDSPRYGGARNLGPRRYGLAVVCALHGVVFAIAAVQLPWTTASWATLLLGGMALAHFVLAALGGLGRERWVRPLWAGLAGVSLACWLILSLALLAAGLHLAALYQGLGAALAAALGVLAAVLALFTVPLACWGLAVTRPWRRLTTGTQIAAGVALGVLVVTALVVAQRRGAPAPVSGWGDTSPEAVWARVQEALPSPPPPAADDGKAKPARTAKQKTRTKAARTTKAKTRAEQRAARRAHLLRTDPTPCAEPVTGPQLTALVTWLDGRQEPTSRCVQAPDPPALERALVALLETERHARARAVVDFVVARRQLAPLHPWIDALGVRPARDGVCAAAGCLAPWQLVALDLFTSEQPLPAVPDFRFGVAPEALARALDDRREEPWVAIETETYVLVDGEAERLTRLRRSPRPLAAADIDRALRAAERHIVEAQGGDGRFRYGLDPFTGKEDWASLNLPRQAGTTLVLCELGRSKASRRAARRSLDLLARHERRLGEASALSLQRDHAALGHTALPLVALLTCREEQQRRHDELIGRLAEFLLRLQREDGSFFPGYDLRAGHAAGEHEALYASGQAVLALVLLEQRLSSLEGAPDAERVGRAIDRAMDFYAGEYWPRLLRDFFYVEENWHCLAARAALSSHRRPHYERFCLDYVAFKSRLILREGEVAPELVGGFGVTPLFEPHYTGTAGHGEALAAALAVQRARGEERTENLAVLEDLLGFLVRAQWDAASCFACSPRQRVLGGFSEHVASPIIRIDYVQHALAALGHGKRELFPADAAPASGS
ncbi:MAG: hypothetical protein GX607_13195 [Myxococcales bacterium]|nr:hypothetical protein [Myxococcales bacterium]